MARRRGVLFGALLSLSLLLVALPPSEGQEWMEILEGVRAHKDYRHIQARKMIVDAAKRLATDNERAAIVDALLEEAGVQHTWKKEAVGRGLVESAMAVAKLLSSVQLIQMVSDSFLNLNFPEEAMEGYKYILQLKPRLASAYHQIGMCFAKMNRIEEAFEAYNQAIEIDREYAISYNNMGVLLSKMGSVEEAYAHFKAAVTIEPKYEQGQKNLHTAERHLQAIQHSGQGASLIGASWEKAWETLSEADANKDQNDAANVALRALLVQAKAKRKSSLPGVVDLMLKTRLVESIDKAIKATNPQALSLYGTLLIELQAYGAAAKVYERIQQLLPDSAEPYHHHAVAMGHLAMYEEALVGYEKALRIDPFFVKSYNSRGVLHSKLGESKKAIADFEVAIKLDPVNAEDTRHNMGVLMREDHLYGPLVKFHQEAEEAIVPPPISGGGTPPITIASYLQSGDAIAQHAVGMQRWLEKKKHQVRLFDVNAPNATAQPELANGMTIVTVEPYRLEPPRAASEYRIYLTVFESSKIPAEWVRIINENANEVWTTCSWLKLVFESSGVRVPTAILPIGTQVPVLKPLWHKTPPPKVFTFLAVANMQPRKGLVELVEAFLSAFRRDKSVLLRVHAKWGDAMERTRMVGMRGESNIEVTEGTLSDDEMHNLWRSADCVVALSKGEGWGQVPREALSLGIPVVISSLPVWDDLKEAKGHGRLYRVRNNGYEDARYEFTTQDTGRFIRPDWLHAQEVMRQVVSDHRGSKRRAGVAPLGMKTWEQAVTDMSTQLKKEIVVFTASIGQECGIATYTMDLFGGHPRFAFARSWSDVFVLAKQLSPKIIHIQHEHGLHPDEVEFLQTLHALHQKFPKIILVITLHTIQPSVASRFYWYHKVGRMAHLIVLHSTAKELVKVPTHYIEHGVPHYPLPSEGRLIRQLHVATFGGFFDQAKRYDQLCDVAERAGMAFDLYSNVPTTHGTDSCRGTVQFYRDFLPAQELVETLSEYTALVFMRKPEYLWVAATGSVRLALNAQVPIVCEDHPQFHDLRDVVDLRPFDQIAARIREIGNDPKLRAQLVDRQNSFAARWTMDEAMKEHTKLYETLKPLSEEVEMDDVLTKEAEVIDGQDWDENEKQPLFGGWRKRMFSFRDKHVEL